MQRLRILLNLAEKNLALGQDQAASDNYQQIIKTFPDYTDRGKVYEHLATLARKMNNTLEADAFEAEAKRLSQIRGQ